MGDQLTNWPGNATKAPFLEIERTKGGDFILQGACTASKIRGQPVSGGAHFFPDAIDKQPLLHWKPSLLMSSFQYFPTGLLRYNSQAIKFTALTYMTQRFLAYETLTIILYLIPVTPKTNSIAILSYSFPSLWQIASYVLSLHTCLLCIFHINGTTCYVAFCARFDF